jgi:hypothetical protein
MDSGKVENDPSEELSKPHQPEVDDKTVSEVVRKPTRTAGDLSEAADASVGTTTEDLARDLEAVASKQGAPTEREFLADLLERVKRIEEQLGNASTGSYDQTPMAEISELRDRIRRIERSSDDLRERVSRIERKLDASPAQRGSPRKPPRGPAPRVVRPQARPDQPEESSKPEE